MRKSLDRIRRLFSLTARRSISAAFKKLLDTSYTDAAAAVAEAERILQDPHAPVTAEERRVIEQALPVWKAIQAGKLLTEPSEVKSRMAQVLLRSRQSLHLQQQGDYQALLTISIERLSEEPMMAMGSVLVDISDSAAQVGQNEVAEAAARMLLAWYDLLSSLHRAGLAPPLSQEPVYYPVRAAVSLLEKSRTPEIWERILRQTLEGSAMPWVDRSLLLQSLVQYFDRAGRQAEARELLERYSSS